MKKILVALSAVCIMICSLATVSTAYSRVEDMGLQNRFNGSYYYDIGWARVGVRGKVSRTDVTVMIKKNGVWKARKTTRVTGSANGIRMTCYSDSLQGHGAQSVSVTCNDY